MRLLRSMLGSLLCLLCLGAAVSAAGPTLTFQKIIGDMRGKQQPGQYLSVALDENGSCYLLSQPGRVAIFARDGKYLKSQQVPLAWPFEYRYLSASGTRVFGGDYREDYPWVFSPQRVGSEPGKFSQPSMVACDSTHQQLYVADTGNQRMQRFASENTEVPNMLLRLSGKPLGLAVRGTVLAVITDDQQLTLYDVTGAQPERMAGKKIEPGARCVALGPAQTVVVVYGYGYVKQYALTAEGIKEAVRVTTSAMDDWPHFYPAGVPLVSGPDGQIWFATDLLGKLLSLDPATDIISERGAVPWRTVALGFGNKGQLYVAGYATSNTAGPAITVYPNPARTLGDGAPYWKTGALYAERGVPIWGLLPDDDGSVYVRVVEEGYEKGWPTLAIKKITPEGTSTPVLEFKSLFAKRTKFGPSEANYALKFDA
ncbi:MAG TPA: hypothetical protein VGL77_06735, partial [Armatimonadota bacterium]